MKWIELALISMSFGALATLGVKYALSKGLRQEIFLFYIVLFAFVSATAFMFYSKQSFQIKPIDLLLVFLVSLAFIIANFAIVKSIEIAPNPGYAMAIAGMQGIIVAVGAFYLFKSSFSIINGIGVVLAVISIYLIGK